MSRLYIVFITFLYFINISNSTNVNDTIGLLQVNQIRKLQDSIMKQMEGRRDTMKKTIKTVSSAVVLIYTISNCKKYKHKKDRFYNSAIKPRKNKMDYKYGVTNGVILSSDGMVVTTYNATRYSDEYIIEVDSEKNQNDALYGEIEFTNNTYRAEVIDSFPELNLTFLQIKHNRNETFNWINIMNDTKFRTRGGKSNGLYYDAITIGKCKGEDFVTAIKPYNEKNKFDMWCTVIGNVLYKEIEGIPVIALITPITCNGSLPENHGGALIKSNGKLIGIPYVNWTYDSSKVNRSGKNDFLYESKYDCLAYLPISYAIPARVIKTALGLVMTKITHDKLQIHCGIEVLSLSNIQRELLKNSLKCINIKFAKDVLGKIKQDEIANKFSTVEDIINNNKCGVIVTKVKKSSIAEQAGIIVGDILVLYDDKCIQNPQTFYNFENYDLNKTSTNITLLRQNKFIKVDLVKYTNA